MRIYSLETITVVCINTSRLPKKQNHTEIPIKNGIKYYRFIEWLSSSRDRKLTFLGTNACHEVGIEMNIMLKETGSWFITWSLSLLPFESWHHLRKNIAGKKMRNQTFFIIFFKNKIKQNACLPLRKKNKNNNFVLSKAFKISNQFMIHVHRV